MPLAPLIKTHLARLGATLHKELPSPVETLTQHVAWPTSGFRNAVERLRAWYIERGDDEAAADDDLEDALPLPPNNTLRITPPESRVYEWEGWESIYTGVDPQRYVPFGSDDHFFYFLTANPSDPGDPIIVGVDHEEATEEPGDVGFSVLPCTVGFLLTLLEPAPDDEDEDDEDEEADEDEGADEDDE